MCICRKQHTTIIGLTVGVEVGVGVSVGVWFHASLNKGKQFFALKQHKILQLAECNCTNVYVVYMSGCSAVMKS